MARGEVTEEELWERATGKKMRSHSVETSFRTWPTLAKILSSGPENKSRLEEQVEHFYEGRLFRIWRNLIENVAYTPESKPRLEERVKSLEEEVRSLKGMLMPKREILKADIIYEKFKEELESTFLGKIVALDIESETIAAIGDSILDVYAKARLKSPKSKFSYKRIGYDYVFRL